MRKFLYIVFFVMLSTGAFAKTFKVGDTILVAFPATNIEDDAYIIGVVKKVTPDGNYQIHVRDYVQDHDYGVSCVPIAVNESGQESTKAGWDLWDDTRQLSTSGLEYIVPADKVMKLSTGKMLFIDRYNVFVTYSRWKDNAPVMSIGKLESTKNEAVATGLKGMVPALELAIKDRASYYDPENGRPYWSYETVTKLTKLLSYVKTQLKNDPKLNRLWRENPRDWKKIDESMKYHFMVDAIDKVVHDAYLIQWADNIEKTDPKDMKKLQSQLKFLGQEIKKTS